LVVEDSISWLSSTSQFSYCLVVEDSIN
jgi:hypothetical protein